MKTALVLGAGGFIGSHLARRLAVEGYRVCGADLKLPAYTPTTCEHLLLADLACEAGMGEALELGRRFSGDPAPFDEIYHLAADMGGAGYIFTGDNDAAVMTNSARINLNLVAGLQSRRWKPRVFFASSACVYPQRIQGQPDAWALAEDMAYPANPDSDYGWEKLFSERLFAAHKRNRGLDVRIARFHNIFGPEGAFDGGREKAPAALCHKVAMADDGGSIEIWGDGCQTRSFLYIDECLEAVRRIMRLDDGPAVLNVGSAARISILDLARLVIDVSGKSLSIFRMPGPQGVRGRCSDNNLLARTLGWSPTAPLRNGIQTTYDWISRQLDRQRSAGPGQ
jgi:GDP-D-mannose 3',5'-epimerase